MINLKKNVILKLQIPAGKATPSPPIGPALGQKGVNIIEFCKIFNDQTKDIEKGLLLPVVIIINSNKTFKIIIKKPPVVFLLKKFLNLKKGSSKPKLNQISSISIKQIIKIAKEKISDLTSINLEGAIKTIIGTIKSMGIIIEN